jgi:uncharacterized OB-fold protein
MSTDGMLRPIEVARCVGCGRYSWYPRAICTACGESTAPSPRYLTGQAYSVTEVFSASTEFAAQAPYEVALVDCTAGIRVLARTPGGLRIGADVMLGTLSVGERSNPIPFAHAIDDRRYADSHGKAIRHND